MSAIAAEEVEKLAFGLTERERARLAEKLIASLPAPSAEGDEDWVEEALCRDREMDEDPDSVMTHEEFFKSLRDHIR